MIFRILLVFIFLVCLSCKNQSGDINKFSDPVLIKIYNLKDRRLTDSLYQYLDSDNPEYRIEAVLAFASLQDSMAVNKIGKLLAMDTTTRVKKAATLALGQTRCRESERILLGAIAKAGNQNILKDLLEAYGKTTKRWNIVYHSILQNPIGAEGLSWSIYRAGIGGATDSSTHHVAAALLSQQYNEYTRLGAAHYFSRSAKDFDKYANTVISTALNDPDVEVKMAATLALRKIKPDLAIEAITKIQTEDNDYRVRISAARALQNFPFDQTKRLLYTFLQDKNVNVGISASEAIKGAPGEKDWIELSNLIASNKNWRIQSNLYEAALAASGNQSLEKEIKAAYASTANPYHKAALLTALGASFSMYKFIEEEFFKAKTPVLRLSAAAALVSINRHKKFNHSYKPQFADIYKKAIASGDAAVIGTISSALADTTLKYKSIIKDFAFLYEARKKLSLPKDYEALQPLETAINYFEGKKNETLIQNKYNNSIDWEIVKKIPVDQQAIIKTTRGNITLRLFVEEAPGSVANFLKLAHQKYFDQNFFHRVVPNFVIQAGCNRGDGWGSEDYSIRSEFSKHKYKTGSVGMASVGKDTEGTQWFITHSPAPHLDGRYTIFAEVIEGMDVVHYLEVGDQILHVEIPGYAEK